MASHLPPSPRSSVWYLWMLFAKHIPVFFWWTHCKTGLFQTPCSKACLIWEEEKTHDSQDIPAPLSQDGHEVWEGKKPFWNYRNTGLFVRAAWPSLSWLVQLLLSVSFYKAGHWASARYCNLHLIISRVRIQLQALTSDPEAKDLSTTKRCLSSQAGPQKWLLCFQSLKCLILVIKFLLFVFLYTTLILFFTNSKPPGFCIPSTTHGRKNTQ